MRRGVGVRVRSENQWQPPRIRQRRVQRRNANLPVDRDHTMLPHARRAPHRGPPFSLGGSILEPTILSSLVAGKECRYGHRSFVVPFDW